MSTVRIRKNAPHVPAHHWGDLAEVIEERRLSFGIPWYRIRFEDGCALWILPERTEEVES